MKARPLPPGGTIGVSAPSSPYENRSELDRGVRWWESLGYRVRLQPGVHARDDYVAGDPRDRARELVELFEDPEVDAVQVLRGGYGCSEIVPFVDLDAIGRNAKPFVGFSDITVLHLAIRQATGLVTFYGPGLGGVGATDREFTRARALRALTDPAPLGEIPARPDDEYVGSLGSGRASGTLVGGCLWLLRETLATPWQFDVPDGAILFFEDVHIHPWRADAVFTQLRHAGLLERVGGVAIGEFAHSDHMSETEPWLRSRSLEDVFQRHLEPLGVPVVFNLPLGHGKQLCTIPLGVQATVDADARTLSIDEGALAPDA